MLIKFGTCFYFYFRFMTSRQTLTSVTDTFFTRYILNIICSCWLIILGPFHIRNLFLKFYFDIKKFLNFSIESKHFHIRNKLSKANIDDAVDTLFDVCKHWPTDQSQCSISEIYSLVPPCNILMS